MVHQLPELAYNRSKSYIGANRPALGGTVPNLTAMSRCPALLTFYPTFFQFRCKCCANYDNQCTVRYLPSTSLIVQHYRARASSSLFIAYPSITTSIDKHHDRILEYRWSGTPTRHKRTINFNQIVHIYYAVPIFIMGLCVPHTCLVGLAPMQSAR